MRQDHLAVSSVAVLVVVLTLATGPHLHLLPIPEGGFSGGNAIGEGFADVDVLSPPGNVTLESADYADVHYLRVPNTKVTVSNVKGTPLLTVSIDIQDLGYSRSSVFALQNQSDGSHAYGIEGGSILSQRIDRETYEGTLRFVLRDDRGRTVLYEDQITIEVTE